MAKVPFQRSEPKVGRNERCPCGSGRKFKECHGGIENTLPVLLARDRIEKEIIAQGERYLKREKAKQLQRQKQQGLGRPIVSTEYKGYRFVAVGNKLFHGKWKTFADFLTDYIRMTLGREWGNAEIAKPLGDRHPILQWYDKICRLQIAHAGKPGELYSTPVTGAVSAYNRLAYNLYLIAHNGKDIQTRLIARLKDKNSFQGAYFETQVAAWLIKAGFELEFENEDDRSSTHCEFTATYVPTGEKYSVEAKSRQIETDHSGREKVRRKLHQALEKAANHKRLIFIDLNKPLDTENAANRALDRADRIVAQSQGDETKGHPAPSAYVCITNMNDQYRLDESSTAMAAFFRGFKIDDFMGTEFPSIIAAIRARERHWPMFQLFKSMKEHREVPQTFGGELPSEMFSKNPPPRIRIGDIHAVPGPNGEEVHARIDQAVVMDGKAFCVCHDAKTGKNFIVTMPLTPEELADYEKYPDTFFGEYHRQSGNLTTAVELFDFTFESYRHTPKHKLLEFLANHPDIDGLRLLPQKDLAEIYSEGIVRSVMQRAAAHEGASKTSTQAPPVKPVVSLRTHLDHMLDFCVATRRQGA